MEKIWILILAFAIFLVLNFVFYRSMKSYVKSAFGKKWLKLWSNKLYFWQSSVFVSIAGTALIMFVLKWANVLSF